MSKHNNKNNKGFTLIELLVVVGIIGVLSAVVLTTVSIARERVRDSVRKAELTELHKAIAHYYSSFGSFPSTGGDWFSSEVGDAHPDNNGNYIPGLVAAGMITTLPRDPLGGKNLIDCETTGESRAYLYRSDGQHFKLLSNCSLENNDYPVLGETFYDPLRSWALQITDSIEATGTCGDPATSGPTCW